MIDISQTKTGEIVICDINGKPIHIQACLTNFLLPAWRKEPEGHFTRIN